MPKKIAIIGAGPAGLTAAYQLVKAGMDVTLFEKDSQYVGGISRTETYKRYHFDVGGHRFFSKSREVEDFWTEILGDDLLERPRSSRIYYNRKFFAYPLQAAEALQKLGLIESSRCILSYLQAKLFPVKDPTNLEDWVSNQFGKRLYRIFFKTYTEKVWGVPCKEISADWAAQRIKGLSLGSAIRHAFFKKKPTTGDPDRIVKTLIDSFRYPRKGPGMMWERCLEKGIAFGLKIEMNACVRQIQFANDSWSIATTQGCVIGGFDYVLSSAPMREIVSATIPGFPQPALTASQQLKYRDFLMVALICKDEAAFSDNWIYIHEPGVKVGRIQNFKSWSPEMVPDPSTTCYGLEYFVFEGDDLWASSNEELIELAKKELDQIGLADSSTVVDAAVVRQPKAYPVYDEAYRANIGTIRAALKDYPGLYFIGRNGMHKYNNQDHSMMTAMLAAKNIIAGKPLYDLWKVNDDAQYHEEGEIGAEVNDPEKPAPADHVRTMKKNTGKFRKKDVLGVLFISALVRIFFYCHLHVSIFGDTPSYIHAKVNIFKGMIDVLRTPVYPWLLNSIKLLGPTHNFLHDVAIVQVLISFCSIFFFYKIALYLLKIRTTVVAATLLYGISPTLINFDMCVLTESVAISGMVFFVFLITDYLKSPSVRKAALYTLFIFLLVMLKPGFLYLYLGIGVFWFARLFFAGDSRRHAYWGLLSLGLCILLILGYKQWNKKVNGCDAISSVSNINQLEVVGVYGLYPSGGDPEMADIIHQGLQDSAQFFLPALVRSVRENHISPDRISRFVTKSIRAHPGVFVKKTISRLYRMQSEPIATIYAEKGEHNLPLTNLLMHLDVFNFFSVSVLLLVAAALGLLSYRKTGEISWLNAFLWIVVTGHYAVVFLGAVGEHQRLFVPALPLAILLAVATAFRLTTVIRSPEKVL